MASRLKILEDALRMILAICHSETGQGHVDDLASIAEIAFAAIPQQPRFNHITVTWLDPNNRYEEKHEVVFDQALIKEMGGKVTKLKVTLVGCTSAEEAKRKAGWMLQTQGD